MSEQVESVITTAEGTSEAENEVDTTVAQPADAVAESVADEPTTAEGAVTTEVTAETGSDSATASEEEVDPGSDDLAASEEEDVDAEGRVVKLLSVGQKVIGKVKRITEFGAFVDIGVGRDGLIHISELSVRRVGKVTDVLVENQEVDVWIKKLDRDRNRISLTLIEPGTKTIRDLQKDELVNGTVTRILPYGAFVDIGIGRDALLHIREMSEGYVARPEDVVAVGDEIEARIIDLSRRRQRVDLSIKGLRPEPDVAAPEPEAVAPAEAESPEDEVVDNYADVEVLSPMELAFKRAMEAEGIELKDDKRRRRKGKHGRSLQDEIIARTLGVVSDKG
jgi:transcriptional accessory protein Tex/SPT6